MKSVPRIAPQNVVYGLYCLCHPDRGIRYVGQTIRGADNRLVGHLSYARKKATYPVSRWIRKHNFRIDYEILGITSDPENLNEMERFWIAVMGTMVPAGMNVTAGGDSGYALTQEHRDRLAAAHAGVQAGNKSPQSKIDEMLAKEIKYLIWSGLSTPEVVMKTGVPKTTVSHISSGETWLNVPWPVGPRPNPRATKWKAERSRDQWTPEKRAKRSEELRASGKLNEAQVREIYALYVSGKYSMGGLGKRFGVSKTAISLILKRKNWAHLTDLPPVETIPHSPHHKNPLL